MGPAAPGGLATTNGLVIAHLAGTIAAFDPHDGHGLWSRPFSNDGTMAALDGTVVTDDGTTIVAVDATTGQQLWTTASEDPGGTPRALAIGPHLLAPGSAIPLFAFSAGAAVTRAFDLRGGDERWRTPAAHPGEPTAAAYSGDTTLFIVRGAEAETLRPQDGAVVSTRHLTELGRGPVTDLRAADADLSLIHI